MRTGTRSRVPVRETGFMLLALLTLHYSLQAGSTAGLRPGMAESLGPLAEMVLLGDYTSKRASSWNRFGQNKDHVNIAPGGTHVLLEEKGAGIIKHVYWTYIDKDEKRRENLFRGLVFRAFWDGSAKPAIEVPLGDLFGVSNGLLRPIESLAFVTNPGSKAEPDSWGFNCYLPMPFAEGARIEVENQGPAQMRIWYHIDYQLFDSPTAIPPQAGRLHALWRRENLTTGVPFPKGPDKNNMTHRWKIENLTGKENYSILDVEGDGQFVGYFLTVVNLKGDPWTWWGEGDDMVFIDGESFPPSIHGTGSEEIFGGGACPAVEFSGPYTGFHCVENWNGENWLGTNGMYRFYVSDAIRFRKSIRVTLEHGHGNNKANDYSSVAFWYQKGVNQKLPPLPPLSERLHRTEYTNIPKWMEEQAPAAETNTQP
ncbi:MAG: glycoside hydrolase family 172 protein [Acidobacteriota bacterium]